MRFIQLTTQEAHALTQMRRGGMNDRIRSRAQALLLSSRGYKMDQLADIFEVDRDTIADWFNRWESRGMKGLFDSSRSGRPPSLDEEEKKNF